MVPAGQKDIQDRHEAARTSLQLLTDYQVQSSKGSQAWKYLAGSLRTTRISLQVVRDILQPGDQCDSWPEGYPGRIMAFKSLALSYI